MKLDNKKNCDKLYRLFYSQSQKMDECTPQVLIDGEWKEYTEWTEGTEIECSTNWLDAIVIYEGFEKPEIRTNFCGYCMRCEEAFN